MKLLFSFYKSCLVQAIFILIFGLRIAHADLIWQQTVSTMGNSQAYAICVDGTGVYVAGITNGYGPGTTSWRVEKRDLTTGNVIIWDNAAEVAQLGTPRAIAVDASFVYIGGSNETTNWFIQKRNLTTGGVICSTSGGFIGQVMSIAVDSSGVYAAGWKQVSGSWWWYVEKRSLDLSTLIWSFTPVPTQHFVTAYAMAINANSLYITGYWGGNNEWVFERRNLNDGAYQSIWWPKFDDPSVGTDYPYGIALDPDGSGFYVVGYDRSTINTEWCFQKMDLDGNGIWGVLGPPLGSNPTSEQDIANGVAVDANAIYVVGYQGPGSNEKWRVEKRNKTNGSLICAEISDPSNISDRAFAIAIDATGMYLAGYQADGIWRVEKRGLACSYVDCGLRVYDGTTIVPIACEPLGTLTSSLRIGKNGNVYGVILVDTSDSNASKVRVKTSLGGTKSLRKYP